MEGKACKGCQKAIVDDQYRLVADWPFCLACFERLSNRREGRPAAPPAVERDPLYLEPSPHAETGPLRRGGATGAEAAFGETTGGEKGSGRPLLCMACQKEMTAADQAQMGRLGICIKCRQALIVQPFQKVLEREARQDAAQAEDDKRALEAASSPIPREEDTHPGTAGKKRCTACSRRLLEPSGYQLLDGKPYCPDCFEEKTREAGTVTGAADAPALTAGHAQTTCDRASGPWWPTRPQWSRGSPSVDPASVSTWKQRFRSPELGTRPGCASCSTSCRRKPAPSNGQRRLPETRSLVRLNRVDHLHELRLVRPTEPT